MTFQSVWILLSFPECVGQVGICSHSQLEVETEKNWNLIVQNVMQKCSIGGVEQQKDYNVNWLRTM